MAEYNVNEVLLFCDVWRSREEIMDKFNLSAIEGWHCVRWLGKLKHDIIVEKRVGATGRAYMYKTRRITLSEIKEGLKEKKILSEEEIEKISEASEIKHMDGDEEKVEEVKPEPEPVIEEVKPEPDKLLNPHVDTDIQVKENEVKEESNLLFEKDIS